MADMAVEPPGELHLSRLLGTSSNVECRVMKVSIACKIKAWYDDCLRLRYCARRSCSCTYYCGRLDSTTVVDSVNVDKPMEYPLAWTSNELLASASTEQEVGSKNTIQSEK